MSLSIKYPRTLHFPFSPGTSSDDRILPIGYLEYLLKINLVITEKLDGQNNCINKYGVFARSHASPSIHEWDKPLWGRYELIKNDLKDLEIFGENMYGIHSIKYNKLESYYYIFAIREKDVWLSWEEVKFYSALLDFPVVPEINQRTSLKRCKELSSIEEENHIVKLWLNQNLGISIDTWIDTKGTLDGEDVKTGKSACEGIVVRNSGSFKTNDGDIKTEENELNNVYKWVRGKHVGTNEHWTKTWKPAKLIDYSKHHWESYEYLSSKAT